MRYIIPQKMSNSGSIHDIASDHYDRIISGRGRYAVVLASYYGGEGYSTHLTSDAACKRASKLGRKGYSYQIIDQNGNTYTNVYGKLVKD